MRIEWEEQHAVTEELVEGPPSRRANATLTPCPSGNHLWCIGGEFFSDDGKAVSGTLLNVDISILMPLGPMSSIFTTTYSDIHRRRYVSLTSLDIVC